MREEIGIILEVDLASVYLLVNDQVVWIHKINCRRTHRLPFFCGQLVFVYFTPHGKVFSCSDDDFVTRASAEMKRAMKQAKQRALRKYGS